MNKLLPFHLYKLQFRDEATLFPSSAGIDNASAFVETVLRWSMQLKLRQKRRWVVADLVLDTSLESTILSGQLVRLKKTKTIRFEEQDLRLDPAETDDADTLAFFLDSKNEYFLLQFSTQIDDTTSLNRFRDFFDKADPQVRLSKRIFFESINPSEDAIQRLRQNKVRKITVKISSPNGEIDRAFKILEPALENTEADELTLTWESQRGLLNVQENSTIDDAVTLAGEYGSWKATPLEREVRPIVSDETPMEANLLANSRESLLLGAKRFFETIRERFNGRRAQERE